MQSAAAPERSARVLVLVRFLDQVGAWVVHKHSRLVGRLGVGYIPAYLMLSILELLLVAHLYPMFLEIQGRMLRNREQRILEIVTAKVE